MTVVSAMKFNPMEGAIISDEQASTQQRKYDLATKIRQFEGMGAIVFAGGSGTADMLYDIEERLEGHFMDKREQIRDRKSAASLVSEVMTETKRDYIQAIMHSRYGLSESELQSGTKISCDPNGNTRTMPIDKRILDQYHSIVEGRNEEFSGVTHNMFLLLASDSEGVEIYTVNTNICNPVPVSTIYRCIGSGQDMADAELSSYMDRVPKEQRNSMDLIQGIKALLNSTEKASAKNIGVGGTPSLYIVSGDEVITPPTENHTRLAMEIVKADSNGFLYKGFADRALRDLIYGGADFGEVEEMMWEKTSRPDELNLMLRGYRVTDQS
ncbi:MAG: hypothetical protein R6U32_03550 [Candidatus Woesearchaeota archaeon]